MINTLIAILLIFAVFALWLGMQHLGRSYALRHPELGAHREEGSGCAGCTCKNHGTCTSKSKTD